MDHLDFLSQLEVTAISVDLMLLLTHHFAMVIPNVYADLLQPVQGSVLSAALHLISNFLSEKRKFRTVAVKFQLPNHMCKYSRN